MKNNTKFIGLMALSACLLCSSPDVVAQASPSDNTATKRDYNDGDDDNGKWGLAGLIGLVGLLGLRGRDKDYDRRTTTTVNR